MPNRSLTSSSGSFELICSAFSYTLIMFSLIILVSWIEYILSPSGTMFGSTFSIAYCGFFISHSFRKFIAFTSSRMFVHEIPNAFSVSRLFGSCFSAF